MTHIQSKSKFCPVCLQKYSKYDLSVSTTAISTKLTSLIETTTRHAQLVWLLLVLLESILLMEARVSFKSQSKSDNFTLCLKPFNNLTEHLE